MTSILWKYLPQTPIINFYSYTQVYMLVSNTFYMFMCDPWWALRGKRDPWMLRTVDLSTGKTWMKRSTTVVMSNDTYQMYCIIIIMIVTVGMVIGWQEYQLSYNCYCYFMHRRGCVISVYKRCEILFSRHKYEHSICEVWHRVVW